MSGIDDWFEEQERAKRPTKKFFKATVKGKEPFNIICEDYLSAREKAKKMAFEIKENDWARERKGEKPLFNKHIIDTGKEDDFRRRIKRPIEPHSKKKR